MSFGIGNHSYKYIKIWHYITKKGNIKPLTFRKIKRCSVNILEFPGHIGLCKCYLLLNGRIRSNKCRSQAVNFVFQLQVFSFTLQIFHNFRNIAVWEVGLRSWLFFHLFSWRHVHIVFKTLGKLSYRVLPIQSQLH